MKTIFIPFKLQELTAMQSYLRLHKFQFDLKNLYPTVRFYDYSSEQFEELVMSTYNHCADELSKILIKNLIDSYDPAKHCYGELYFEVRCLGYYESEPDELFLMQYNKYPWTLPVGIMLDRAMVKDMFEVVKTPQQIVLEEGETNCRIMECSSRHPITPEWDAYNGCLQNLYIQERYLTSVDVALKPRCKLETYINNNFSETEGVPIHRINKNLIYDVRMVNLSTDRYDRAVKVNAEDTLELIERVEEFKEILSWKDLPEKSESAYVGQDQNFFGVDVHVTGDARARVSIADKQVSLKYWNKEVIAALYVDAAIRTHKNFIKDWERKLNFPTLKQIVVCPCPICQKGKKFPRRSSQYPDNLIYTKEYKEQFKPEEF